MSFRDLARDAAILKIANDLSLQRGGSSLYDVLPHSLREAGRKFLSFCVAGFAGVFVVMALIFLAVVGLFLLHVAIDWLMTANHLDYFFNVLFKPLAWAIDFLHLIGFSGA